MVQPRSASLTLSRSVLSVLVLLNWVYGAGILALLVASHAQTNFFVTAMGLPSYEPAQSAVLGHMRMIMVLGILSVPLTYVVISRLLAIVETVRTGGPFIMQNAQRLQTIAWAILGLEFTHVVVGIAARGIPHFDVGSPLSLTRWLAVLLLFVLARVFEQGARMREEIEGTI